MAGDSDNVLETPMTKKDKILLGTILTTAAVVLIILIASITLFILEPKSGDSPEATFRSLIDGMDSGNFRQVYDASVFSLNMTYDEFEDAIGEMADADFDIIIKSLDIVTKEEMSQEQREEVEEMLPDLEAMIEADIEDYGLVDFTINLTQSGDGGSHTTDVSETIVCVMVDSRWYLVFPTEDDMEDEPAPQASLTMTDAVFGTRLNVMWISRADVEWSDVDIILSDGTNTITWHPNTADLTAMGEVSHNYSGQVMGPLEVCLNVTDINGNGTVDVGDSWALVTYEGAPAFSSATRYTVSIVYSPLGTEISRVQFYGVV